MANQNSTLTQEYLQSLFYYKDGYLYRKTTNKPAGGKRKDGYFRSYVDGKIYYNHRLIFMICHGYMPEYIDHIDGNPSNNNIQNLRVATLQKNNFNRKKNTNNLSGCKNVFWSTKAKKWRVQIRFAGKQKSFGYFESLELAELVAKEAREKYHGDWCRHE